MTGQTPPADDDIVDGTVIEETPPAPPHPRAASRARYAVLMLILVGFAGAAGFLWQDREQVRNEAASLTNDVEMLRRQMEMQTAQMAAMQQQIRAGDDARAQLANDVAAGQTAAASARAHQGNVATEFAALEKSIRRDLDQLTEQLTQLASEAEAGDNVTEIALDKGATGAVPAPAGPGVVPMEQQVRDGAADSITAPPVKQALLIAQTELVVINGIMLQNQTGEALAQWREMITDLVRAGAPAPAWAVLQMAIDANPPSRAILVAQGQDILRQRITAMHTTPDDASTLDRLFAAVRRFVHLRPADGSAGGVAGAVTQFEDALRVGNLAAAVEIAAAWSAEDLAGLTDWQAGAADRVALDRAVSAASADVIDRLASLTATKDMK